MAGLSDAVEWVIKRISALTRTATDADLTDSEYMAVDNASAYTRKITVASLAKWILGKIKSLPTTIPSFRTGDVIPVDGPDGPAKMSKDDLLKETAAGWQKYVSTDSLTSQVKPDVKKNNLVSGNDGTVNGIQVSSLLEVIHVSGTTASSNGVRIISKQISFDSAKNYTLVIIPAATTRDLTFGFYSNDSVTHLKVDNSVLRISVSNSTVIRNFKPDASGDWGLMYRISSAQTDDEYFAAYLVEGELSEEDVFELGVRCSTEISKQQEKNEETDEEIVATNERITEIADKLKNVRLSDKEDIVIHIPNDTGVTQENASVHINVHKGNQQGISAFNEIFVGDDAMFAEFRFFDGETELNHELIASGNYDIIKDASIMSGQKGIYHLSDNSIIVTKSDGIYRSMDNGETYSRVYEGGTCIFVDSNDNIFLYKNYLVHKYNMTSQVDSVVADFTEKQYTDIWGGKVGEDSEGTIYMGSYAGAYGSTQVYRMKANESEFTQVFDDPDRQHIHRLFVDRSSTPNKIFIGVDGVREGYMPAGYVSEDGGDTWTNLNIPYNNADCGVVFHGDGYYLGCGETNYLGGPTVYRTTDLQNYEGVAYNNLSGARTIFEPVPGFVIAALVNSAAHSVEQLIMSTDNGLTWKPMCVSNIIYSDGSGDGLRYVTDYFKPMGSDEFQVLGDGMTRAYGYRIYIGGSRYMGSFVVNVGDVPVGGKDIVLRRNFMFDTSSRVLTLDKEIHSPIFTMALSEGEGSKVSTSLGKKDIVGATATWEDAVNVNNGSIFGSGARSPKGLVLGESSSINIGKLPITGGSFTLAFWFNPKNLNSMTGLRSYVLRAADNSFRLYHTLRNFSFVIDTISANVQIVNMGYYYESDYYLPYYLVVKYNGVDSTDVGLYIGDGRLLDHKTGNARVPDLSNTDLIIGHNSPSGIERSCLCGLSAIAIFDKALTVEEIMNYNNFRNYIGK